ncbi:iron ABC transporter permease [Pseudonocardia sp. EC080625-04]|uniref:FecCD family ABC transporter permease n=1 Tax=Pseudonocardia sp. EC080625-04 TaxID=1096868 RepID=UPI0006CB4E33|nr:iron chelate uptake ABC transporter family permease subunit [Pseudonocardia sp. EC080625-04]ALE74368.1 iron ABC transporter permease [Pseudonocardia sp. EC080625-04]
MTTTPTRPDERVDFGYTTRTVRTRWLSGRVGVRLLAVSAAVLAVAVAVSVVSLGLGDFRLGVGEVVQALLGGGREFQRIIVTKWRLPVVLAALVFGALLGIGGAIFQSLTRNPLGSPDVIGFDAGSYTGVVLTLLVVGASSYWNVAFAALAGGLLTAFAVYVLAYRGGIAGFRLIIVGIGISAMLTSVNSYLVTRADIDDAMVVGFWAAGSIADVTWTPMLPSLGIAAVIVVATVLLSPALRRLELGDDAAVTQGTRVGAARLGLLVVGVSTTALVTAAAGPIGFVALAAPQLARRLTRSPGVSTAASAAMGAALLASAHLLSLAIAEVYRAIPVGLITVCLGGCYLIWLLVREARRQYGTFA